jgi:phosphomannomutase
VHRLRTAPPSTLGGVDVTSVIDLANGYEALVPTDGVVLELGTQGRVVVRPSGTEPKLKAYVEITATPGRANELGQQRARCQRILDLVRNDLLGLLQL